MQIIEPVSEKHENNSGLYKATGKLIVYNLDKTKDAGIYKCLVEDNSENRNSATLNVLKILGKYIIIFPISNRLCLCFHLRFLQSLKSGLSI